MGDRTLFIDAQVFQSDAWDRGMGKYSLSLLQSLLPLARSEYQDIIFILSRGRSLSVEARRALEKLARDSLMLELDLKIPQDQWLSTMDEAEKYNHQILDKIVRQKCGKKAKADFLILSLFTDHSFSTFPTKTKNILIGYDLIPFLYGERYSMHPNFQSYLKRYHTIFQADAVLAISQTVADDFVTYLGINPNKVRSINGGPIDRASLGGRAPKGLKKSKFILMPSGDDLRKNNKAAAKAFDLFRQSSLYSDMRLIVTSNFTNATKDEMNSLTANIDFVGNVSEAEMKWLYEHCEAVLFVSEYEGLGLPVLEAIEANKPVVCSDISVFREISTNAFYSVDPHDALNIAEGIEAAVDHDQYIEKQKLYKDILDKYTWTNTAKRTIDFLRQQDPVEKNTKKKIAVFTPNPSGYSAIGKLVMQLHPSIAEYFDVDYFYEDATSSFSGKFNRVSYLNDVAALRPAKEFNVQLYGKYDAVVYNVGNSEYHVETIKNALYLPGIVIVHDTDLRSMFKGPLRERDYVDAERIDAEEQLFRKSKSETPYLTSLLNAQRAVITHSEYARAAVKKGSECLVEKANLPSATPALTAASSGKRLNIGIAGILHPIKGIALFEQLLESKELSDCTFSLFGFSMLNEEDLERLSAHPRLRIAINPSDFKFQSMLADLDVLINYRAEYKGETSLTVIEAMRYGVVPIVRDIGWYSELPDDAVVKIKSELELHSTLIKLTNEEFRIQEMAQRAKNYILNNHSFDSYARTLFELTDQLDRSPRNSLVEMHVKAAKKNKPMKYLERIINKHGNA